MVWEMGHEMVVYLHFELHFHAFQNMFKMDTTDSLGSMVSPPRKVERKGTHLQARLPPCHKEGSGGNNLVTIPPRTSSPTEVLLSVPTWKGISSVHANVTPKVLVTKIGVTNKEGPSSTAKIH